MRLFIALNFDAQTRRRLLALQDKLRRSAVSGNFSRAENLHLTVLFLGETDGSLSAIKAAMDKSFYAPAELVFSGTGSFSGGVYWVGVRENPALQELYRGLCRQIKAAGIKADMRDRLTPHITLAREVRGAPDRLDFEEFSCRVPALSLMSSRRQNGRLMYTEIYRTECGEG